MELYDDVMVGIDELVGPLNHVAYYHIRLLMPILKMPFDQILFCTAILSSFLINLGMSHVKGGPTIRRAYSTTAGLLLGFYFHGRDYFIVMLLSQGAWFIAKALPRQSGSTMASTFAFIIMMLGHWSYYIHDRRDLAYTRQLMIVFVKVHMTMCSYADAGKLKLKDNELTATEKRKAGYLLELPSFSNWFHYMQLSASSWCGPFSEYSDYIDFINYDNDSDIANMPSYGNWYDAWKRFAHVWLCAVVFVVLGKFIHFDYFTTSEFVAEPLYYRVFLLCISMQSE